MEKYDYLDAMKNDVLEHIRENNITPSDFDFDRDAMAEKLHDDLWANDAVTGNASGSYTFSTWQAEENLCHNLDLLEEALSEFGLKDAHMLENGAEWADVTIRCYLLGQAIDEALDELDFDAPDGDDGDDDADAEEYDARFAIYANGSVMSVTERAISASSLADAQGKAETLAKEIEADARANAPAGYENAAIEVEIESVC